MTCSALPELFKELEVNKFSMRSISAAAALTAMLAMTAQAQVSLGTGLDVGVRTGVNVNIDSDVRANALGGVHGASSADGNMAARSNNSTAIEASSNSRADARVSGNGGVKGTVSRTGDRVEGAVERGASATKRTANRVVDSVSGVARRADRRIQGALPASARGNGQVNVQGGASGELGGTSR